MTERLQPQICIQFCVKLEHFSAETIRMIQKAAVTGNSWLAVSSQQACSCISSTAEIFGETSNHPGDSAHLQPRFAPLRLLTFPKTKIIFERDEISDHRWDTGKYDGAADGAGRSVRSQGAYLEGDWGVIVLCTVFLVSSSINISIFHSTWLDTSWTDFVYHRCRELWRNIKGVDSTGARGEDIILWKMATEGFTDNVAFEERIQGQLREWAMLLSRSLFWAEWKWTYGQRRESMGNTSEEQQGGQYSHKQNKQ